MRAVSSLLIILMALLPSTASSQNINVQASIDLIIQDYNRSCHAEQSDVPRIDEDPIEPSYMLVTLDPVNIYEIQIDGSGSTATVLYPSFHCKNFGYGSCGTGGCGFFLIVDDQVFFRSGGFEPHSAIIQNAYGTDAVVVYGVHGGGCDDAKGRGGAGVDPCYGAAAWDENAKTFFSRDGELQVWQPR